MWFQLPRRDMVRLLNHFVQEIIIILLRAFNSNLDLRRSSVLVSRANISQRILLWRRYLLLLCISRIFILLIISGWSLLEIPRRIICVFERRLYLVILISVDDVLWTIVCVFKVWLDYILFQFLDGIIMVHKSPSWWPWLCWRWILIHF
jgi:hypothetical protein